MTNGVIVLIAEEQSRGCFGVGVVDDGGEGRRVERAERKSARKREEEGRWRVTRKSAIKGFLFPSG